MTVVEVPEYLRDPTRYSIVRKLYEMGEASLDDLARAVGKHRSTVFRHLTYLMNLGVVSCRRVDHRNLYSLTPEAREKLRSLLELREPVPTGIRVRRYTFALRLLTYLVPGLFLGLGVWGILAPVRVHFITRLIWFTIFTLIAYALYRFLRSR